MYVLEMNGHEEVNMDDKTGVLSFVEVVVRRKNPWLRSLALVV
jgi:hypothetical protein